MTSKETKKAAELKDEQLDSVSGGANLKPKSSPDQIRKLKSSPDNFRANEQDNPTLSSKKL